MAQLAASLSKYNFSINFTIYSKTLISNSTTFTPTKQRPFGLRNLQGNTQEDHIQHAIQIMNMVAQELHHITGFGIDHGKVKQSSTTIKKIDYPELTPTSDESLYYSYKIALKFYSYEYRWVKDGKMKDYIDEAEVNNGWATRDFNTGRTASFYLPAITQGGYFQTGYRESIMYDKHDPIFTKFIERFDISGNLGFGQTGYFGEFMRVGYDYWPEAKHPEKYAKKPPRKSRLATQPTDNTDYVYIIKITGQNIYKIGKSNDPQSRLNKLKTSNPYKIKLVHTFKADNASAAEETLHELLHNVRMEGEWFNIPHAQIQRLIMIERFEREFFWINNQAINPMDLFNR